MAHMPIVGLGFGLSIKADRVPVRRTKPILSEQQIKDLYSIRWTITQDEAAVLFGTSQSIVGRIWNRQAWLKVTDGMGHPRDGWIERRRYYSNDGDSEHG